MPCCGFLDVVEDSRLGLETKGSWVGTATVSVFVLWFRSTDSHRVRQTGLAMPAQVSWCGFCSKRGTPNLGSPKSFIMGSIYPLPQREVLSLSLWTVNRPYHCSVSGDNASVFQGCLLCRILKQIACCKGRHCFCSQARKECKRLLENHLPTAGFIACILIRLGQKAEGTLL